MAPSRAGAALLLLTLGGLLAACSDNTTGPSSTAVTPRLDFVNEFYVIGVTPDGNRAAFESDAGDLYFYDTRTGSLELKTYVGDLATNVATGLSSNGVVTALHGTPTQPAFWTEHSDWTLLTSPYHQGCPSGFGDDVGGAWDVSADGNVIVGLLWNGCNAEPFRWDATGTGMVTPLELLGASFPGSQNPPNDRASKVSRDGQLAGGFAQTAMVDRWPAIWHADGSGALLTGPSEDTPGEVMAISPDGTTVAGYWGFEGFYWSQATGTVMLGQLPGGDPSDPVIINAIAADNKMMLGISGNAFFSIPSAIVWTPGAGIRRLADVITAAGLTIPEGYNLGNVLAASADGTVIAGTATDDSFHSFAFVLHLPASAYGL